MSHKKIAFILLGLVLLAGCGLLTTIGKAVSPYVEEPVEELIKNPGLWNISGVAITGISILVNLLLGYKKRIQDKKLRAVYEGIEMYNSNGKKNPLIIFLKHFQEKYKVREAIMKDITKVRKRLAKSNDNVTDLKHET